MKKTIKRKTLIIFFSLILIFVITMILGVIENNSIVQTNYVVESDKINEFSNFKILQISDFHNAKFGKDNNRILESIKDLEPDIIIVTGDLIDCIKTNCEVSQNFMKRCCEITTVYYALGNHEKQTYDKYLEMEIELKKYGVHILKNQNEIIERNGEKINIVGIDDPFGYRSKESEFTDYYKEQIPNLLLEDCYNILLSHRPEYFEVYANFEPDLVFSGHAHGGQFRLPFFGGVVAPGQGIFPKYDSGIFELNSTKMIVSRGIGNSIIPIRLNNRPELVLTTLN